MKYKDLIRNVFIFSLSSFASKAITLILLPMYSHNLTLSDYGIIDIIQTSSMLLMPFLSLSLSESILKFCIVGEESKNSIISTSIIALCISSAIFLTLSLLVNTYFNFEYLLQTVFFIICLSLYEFISKYAKGIGRSVLFAMSNIILAVSIFLTNIYYIYHLKSGVDGFLKAQIISYSGTIILIFLILRMEKLVSVRFFSVTLLKKMCLISVPLIPNAAMWWIFNASDRWIIYFFDGTSQSGIYAVSNKVAAIIAIANSVIFQAWQIAAIKSKNEDDREQFYSEVVKVYFVFIGLVASYLITMNESLLTKFLSNEFSQAWKVGNLLIFSSVFYCTASFLGVFYVIASKTVQALKTSFIAAIANVIFNFILIPFWGIYGAAIATIISTLIIYFYRCHDVYKIMKFHIDYKMTTVVIILLLLNIYASIYQHYKITVIVSSLFSLLFLYSIRTVIKKVYKTHVK